ncbi:MAG TPA: bifunctional serine/threonine-protein kinase/formylglycine-generating enzyme family protein [Labilithrix sp.]|nr:bifunctional serine/threonine-protein kinase/formylglycine-generating enzyme family protein [Labilithrix sp.]
MAGPFTAARGIGARYVLCGEIASGGMATVHLARQIGAAGFARIVAVKRLHERYSRDPEFVAMFLDEARIVARIRHPNVVQTIDVVAEDGELFLVMEYVHGESLLRLAGMANKKNAPLPVPLVAAIIASALHGLHEAHESRGETGEPLGIVHRDVSPHNLLVGIDGVGRVLDFGVARASQRIQTTHEGQLKGKLSYMAPEQVTNAPIDRRTDVYATSVCLWEALTGTKLFAGGSEAAIVNQILLAPMRPPTNLNRAIPPELEIVVMRGLRREPSERFATARDMALAIERATPLASPAEVGEIVARLCEKTLTQRSRLIASVEQQASSSNLQEAVDSLRTLAAARRSAPQTGAPPPFDSGSGQPLGAPGASFPPLARHVGSGSGRHTDVGVVRESAADRRHPARLAAVIAASVSVVVVLLASAAWLRLARRNVVDGVVVTSSASTLAAQGDGGRSPARVAAADARGVASAAPMPATACPGGMAMVPGGRFFMGSDDDLPAERPAHKVTLHAYCMDKLEVTADAYRACSDRGDCKRAVLTNKWDGITAKDAKAYDPLCNGQDASRGRHPMNCVDWNAADRFCKAEGKRLPSEAEWEFAARGSDGRKYPWGDAPPSAKHLNACGAECVAWGRKHGGPLEALFAESDPWATTAPVGSFPAGASRWGIEDLVGNVWEWTSDYYAHYTDADAEDPTGPASGVTHVMRGGAWNGAYADWVRPSFRFHDAADTRSHGIGFRCALTP